MFVKGEKEINVTLMDFFSLLCFSGKMLVIADVLRIYLDRVFLVI